MTTTTFDVPGFRIVDNLGVVRGVVVRSRSVFGTVGASLQTLVGGNVSLFTELAERTRKQAFDTMLVQHHIKLSDVDRVTAWVMAAIHCLYQFGDLLANEWRERVHTTLLREVVAGTPEATHYARLYRDWETQRPYGRGQDAGPNETYPAYRRASFDKFVEAALRELPEDMRRAWEVKVRSAESDGLPAYQKQMSVLAYLDPGAYGEARVP